MYYLVLFIVGVLCTACCAGLFYWQLLRQRRGTGGASAKFRDELQQRRELKEQIEALYGQMTELDALRQQGRALLTFRESLKTERGRITITQAELETVEARLRELEEIERELQASGTDTQEEIKILEKKRNDLAGRNDNLKKQISASLAQMEAALGEIELSAQMQEQIAAIKTEVVQTQQRIDALLIEIEQGNEQYFLLKKRYDALDIEYAQLYEKFASVEGAATAAQGE